MLTLIVLIIARKGFPNSSRATYLDTDHSWLTIIAVGGYVIILSVMLATYLLGDAMPDKTVSYHEVMSQIPFRGYKFKQVSVKLKEYNRWPSIQ